MRQRRGADAGQVGADCFEGIGRLVAQAAQVERSGPEDGRLARPEHRHGIEPLAGRRGRRAGMVHVDQVAEILRDLDRCGRS